MNNELSKRLAMMSAERLKEIYLSANLTDNMAVIASRHIDEHISERIKELYTKRQKKRLLEQRDEAIESLTKALIITEFLKKIGAEEKHQVHLSGCYQDISVGVFCQFVLQCGAKINIKSGVVFQQEEPDATLYTSSDGFDPVLFCDQLDATAEHVASIQATRNYAFVELCKHYPDRVSIEFEPGNGRIVVIRGDHDDDLVNIHPNRGSIFVIYTLWSGNCKLKGLSSVLKKIEAKVAEVDKAASRGVGGTAASLAADEQHNSPTGQSRRTEVSMGM